MTSKKLNNEEKKRLETLADAFLDIGSLNVHGHLRSTGKLEALQWIGSESEEQEKALRNKNHTAAALAQLKFIDIFMTVARRAATDAELGACVPAGQLDKKDAELLEKHRFKALAAVVRAQP
jgi:hypothetical protein